MFIGYTNASYYLLSARIPISIAKDMLFQSGRSSQSKIYRERHDFAYRMLIAEFASTQELMTKYVARRSMDFSLLTTGASI